MPFNCDKLIRCPMKHWDVGTVLQACSDAIFMPSFKFLRLNFPSENLEQMQSMFNLSQIE